MSNRTISPDDLLEVWRFISDFCQSHPYPPSIREIMRGCDLSSTCTTRNRILLLQEQGVLDYQPDAARTITLLEHPTAISDGLDQRAEWLQERGYLIYWYGNPAVAKYVGFMAFKPGERPVVEGVYP